MVEIFAEQARVKTHIRESRKGQWVTDQQDYPKGARCFLEKGTTECLEEAKEFLVKPSRTHQRKAQAVLRLAETYGPTRLEGACERAILFGNSKYQCLQNILKEGLDQKPLIKEESHKLSPEQLQKGSYLRDQQEFASSTGEVYQ
jgi:hypothetical protein